jgi:type IV pilus modification protein PilV
MTMEIRQTRTQANHEAGMTLLEVLVAMAVFAFVMLGAASAQLVAIASIRDANMRSFAAFSADSLAATMRSNPAFWRNLDTSFELTITAVTDPNNGTVSTTYSATVDLASYNLDFATGSCDTTIGGCLPSEIAVHDLKKWGSAWTSSVIDAVATIKNIASAGETPLLQISLGWRQKQLADTGATSDSAGMLSNQFSTLVKL